VPATAVQRKWVTLPSPLDRVTQNLAAAVDVQVHIDQGTPRVALTELYRNQPVRSFQHAVSLRISHGDDEWNRLAQLPDQSHLLGSEYPKMRKKAAAAIERMAQDPTPVALLRTFRTLVSVLQPHELPTVLRDRLRAWVSGQFPNATLHAVKVDSFLPGRFRSPRWVGIGVVGLAVRAWLDHLVAHQLRDAHGEGVIAERGGIAEHRADILVAGHQPGRALTQHGKCGNRTLTAHADELLRGIQAGAHNRQKRMHQARDRTSSDRN
jgi:hypothetical protein